MMLYLAFFAGLALAQKEKKQKKEKAPVGCFGLEDDNHLACMKLDETACEGNELCKYGTDRVAKKTFDMTQCMKKKGADNGKICTEQDECVCGQQCHYIAWMNKSVCSQCADAGIKDDCVDMGNMSCKWLGGENDGKCVQAKNMCNELGKKECVKAKGKCAYDKAMKTCAEAFERKCVGKILGSHGKCYGNDNKEDCMKVVSMFNKPLCDWGYSKYDDLEKDEMKCQKATNMPIGKTCTTQADCSCGFTCFDNTLWKACNICKDFGIRDDCVLEGAQKMGCVWIAKHNTEDEGICIKAKSKCDPGHFDKGVCDGIEGCEYDAGTDKCNKGEVTKKTCKAISKKKKGEKPDADAMKSKCDMEPKCAWNDKKKKCAFLKMK